jgi:hypothetical protein
MPACSQRRENLVRMRGIDLGQDGTNYVSEDFVSLPREQVQRVGELAYFAKSRRGNLSAGNI